MAYHPSYPNWTPITNTVAHQVTWSTYKPESSYTYATSALPDQLRTIPGVSAAFFRPCFTYRDKQNVAVYGELVLVRNDQGTGKAYLFHIGVSDSTPHFAGPDKPDCGHYFDPASGAPLDNLFGASPKPDPA